VISDIVNQHFPQSVCYKIKHKEQDYESKF